MSKKCAPCASRTNGGNAPAHFTIQFMGTPASSDLRALSNSAFDFGRSSTNFFCSRCMRDCRRARSMVFMSAEAEYQTTENFVWAGGLVWPRATRPRGFKLPIQSASHPTTPTDTRRDWQLIQTEPDSPECTWPSTGDSRRHAEYDQTTHPAKRAQFALKRC